MWDEDWIEMSASSTKLQSATTGCRHESHSGSGVGRKRRSGHQWCSFLAATGEDGVDSSATESSIGAK